MKKILLVLAIIIGFSAGANAQVCDLGGDGDNVAVLSTTILTKYSEVVVLVGNDSQSVSANVTVEIEVTYKNDSKQIKKKKYSGGTTAKPNDVSIIRIPINLYHPDDTGYKAVEVKALGIKGKKCR